MKKHGVLLILIGIFILAFVLRFWNLSDVPHGFHIDEASLGYNGYSILKTGKDDNGNFLPLYIDMFGDNRPSGYHYLTIIPIIFSGLTVFATRLPAALFGSLLVFAFYFLTMVLFKDKRIALVAALFGAIAPWSIVLSRASGEAVVALFFIMTGFALILKSLKDQKPVYLFSGTVLIVASFFFYHTPRVFVPSFFLALFVYLLFSWKEYKQKYRNFFIGSFLATCFVAFALVFLVSGGTGRYSQVNIFGFPETKLVTEEQIREDGIMNSGVLPSKIFHNKATSYFLKAADNYSSYFTGNFLFTKGGLPKWYIVPQMGMLYLVELPFLLFGLVVLFISKNKLAKILFAWLLLAPITAAFTVDDIPNVNRVIVLFPILEIIVSLGLITFIEKVKPKLKVFAIAFIVIIFMYNFGYFAHQYFIHQPTNKNWYRNDGFEEMINKVMNNYDKYDHIIMTKDLGGVYPLILFYMKYDPSLYQKEGSSKDKEYTGFGKFYFVPQECPAVTGDDRFPKGKVMFVENGVCHDSSGVKQEDIKRLDGTPVYHIIYN